MNYLLSTRYRHPLALIVLLAALFPLTASSSDREREQRLAEQTVDAILDGDAIYLETTDNSRFLGIEMEAGDGLKGAAIILHGRGMHPDWSQVAAPLRIGLPAHGWTTLSLQMPVLAKDATYYDYIPIFPEAIPRIEAGIRHLRTQGIERIVLIAHSCSVHMSMAWLDAKGDAGIDALVTIGMGATDYQQPMPKPLPLEKITVPLLSIYGSNDYPAVHRQANELASLLDDMPPLSAVQEVPAADHYFNDHNDELVTAIAAWLDALVAAGK